MRRMFRMVRTVAAGLADAVPPGAAAEAAVSAAFVVLFLALAVRGDHRFADASAAHFAAGWPNAGTEVRSSTCQADVHGKRHRPIATRSIRTRAPRCGNVASYL
jgi:hypothetical protein